MQNQTLFGKTCHHCEKSSPITAVACCHCGTNFPTWSTVFNQFGASLGGGGGGSVTVYSTKAIHITTKEEEPEEYQESVLWEPDEDGRLQPRYVKIGVRK